MPTPVPVRVQSVRAGPAEARAEFVAQYEALLEELQCQCRRMQALIQDCRTTTARLRATRSAGAPRLLSFEVLHLGDADILVARHSVRHGGRIHRLTPTEWQLLAFLLAHANDVHSRAELAVGAGGGGYAGRHGQVEVYVSRLRQKLGPAARRLETVRGSGYRLAFRQMPRLVDVEDSVAC